jgi:hypothetical protein
MSREAEIAASLDAIVVDLDELAFDRLQEALGAGASRRPASDRTLAQARRAVEKAARLLHSLDRGTDEDD